MLIWLKAMSQHTFIDKSFFRRKPKLKFNVHFNDGPFIEYVDGKGVVTANFYSNENLIYSTQLSPKHWGKCFRKYYSDWKIEILSESGESLYAHQFNPVNKRIRVNIDSKSLGDTLAWVPQVNELADKLPRSEIYCASFFPELNFEQSYNKIRFIEPDSSLADTYATYNIGYYFANTSHHHPNDPRTVPLGQVAADILGFKYREIRPKIHVENTQRLRRNAYVCIATKSTAACKLWLFERGWQTVIDYLNSKGLDVLLIQKEKDDFTGVINKSGDHRLQDRITDILHCEFFIGLGSGLSWLAWALDKPVILISGFSQPFTEFRSNCHRIINTDVCHGCWNSTQCTFDRGDWDWCPLHRSTPRQHECSRKISPKMVIEKIDRLMCVK